MAKDCIVDPDDLDEKGLLKDGRSLRVPVYMRDNATVADIPASLQGLSMRDRAAVLADIGARFGRRTGYAFADKEADRVTRMRARDAYVTDMNDAWRTLGSARRRVHRGRRSARPPLPRRRQAGLSPAQVR